MSHPWYIIANVDIVSSPALVVFPERIRENIRRMIVLAGDAKRLRPHVKTHKMAELVRMQLEAGITKFKCATIAEAEMTAQAGARDVLFAYQPVGPNVGRLIQLIRKFPSTKFSTIGDDAHVLTALSQAATEAEISVEVLLDIDCGMHRAGIVPGPEAAALYRLLTTLPGLTAGGFHAYDGHLNQPDRTERALACDAAFEPVQRLRESLVTAGLPVPRIVLAGTPTFPIHAARGDVELGPGTSVLWDYGYGSKLLDLDFLPAAIVLTRVVSKPWANRICLDLGHKAVASENPHPRVYFPDLPDAKAIGHSEEHLVLETASADTLQIGTPLYGIPWHICPTVALHAQAVVVESGRAVGHWRIAARDRVLTV